MPTSTNNTRPNILFIVADQLTPFVLSAYRRGYAKTPNLDALCEKGAVFENAYCNFPLCVPSRASFITGRLANNIESWDNATELSASVPTLAHYLRLCGYNTTLAGKMHFIGPDQLHGYQERLTTDIYPANFAWTPDWIVGERYRPTGINMSAVIDAGTCVRSLQLDYDEEVVHCAIQKLYDLARFDHETPFFLTVSFTHPHSPYIIPERYWSQYTDTDIPEPEVDPIPVEQMDKMSEWLYYAHAGDRHVVTPEHVQTARQAYLGMVTYIDDKVGDLLEVLDQTNQRENTVIVFTSDHGEMLGERGMWFKQSFFEWSCRVPLVIARPGQSRGTRIVDNVSLVDLAPTLLDIAAPQSQDFTATFDGSSLLARMNDDPAPPERAVIAEYTGEGVCAPCRMVKQGSYKFIYTHGHPNQLFNLAADPLELNDLHGSSEHRGVEQTLQEIALSDWNPDDIAKRAIASQQARFLIHRATKGQPTWSYRVADDDTRYVRNKGAVQRKALARYPFVEPTPFNKHG